MHQVKFTVPERELGKSDIEFKIRKGGKAFGTLRVSRGGVDWLPKDTSYGHRISWTEMDAHMKTRPKQAKR